MPPSPSELAALLEKLHDAHGQADDMADVLAAVVVRRNRENALPFLRTPYRQRIVFVPQCLRSTARCQAEQRNGEYFCKNCGACKIAEISRRARDLGYIGLRILKGGSALPRLIADTKPAAVLGISCCMEGVLGVIACERAGVPAFCVPLLKTGCSDTDVDLSDVWSALETVLS